MDRSTRCEQVPCPIPVSSVLTQIRSTGQSTSTLTPSASSESFGDGHKKRTIPTATSRSGDQDRYRINGVELQAAIAKVCHTSVSTTSRRLSGPALPPIHRLTFKSIRPAHTLGDTTAHRILALQQRLTPPTYLPSI